MHACPLPPPPLRTLAGGYVCEEMFFRQSEIRAEIQMKSGNLFWAKNRRTGELVDLQGLFNDCERCRSPFCSSVSTQPADNALVESVRP